MAKTSEKAINENTAKEHIIPFVKPEQFESPQVFNLSERLSTFIQNNRRIILTLSIGAAVILAGSIAGLGIKDALRAKAISQVEEFNRRYEILAIDLQEPSKEGEVSAFVEELSRFASKHGAYAGARGYAILGSLYMEKKDWEAAEKAWIAGAKAGAKTYLGAVSFFNAAVAAEEQGNLQGAIDLYTQSIAKGDQFPGASRAQFQIGRLEETQNHREAAIQAYREVINKWPQDTAWNNLAQSKIIALTLP